MRDIWRRKKDDDEQNTPRKEANPDKGKQKEAKPGGLSEGEARHTRFSIGGFGRRGDPASTYKLNAMSDALGESTIEGVAGPSTSYSETGATYDLKRDQKEAIKEKKHQIKTKLLAMANFVMDAETDKSALYVFDDPKKFISDSTHFIKIKSKASEYIKSGKIDCNVQQFNKELDHAIGILEGYERKIGSMSSFERQALMMNANPEIKPHQSEVILHLHTIEAYYRENNDGNRPTWRTYINSVQRAFGLLSPEASREYRERLAAVKFVVDYDSQPDDPLQYPKAQRKSKSVEGVGLTTKWEFTMPTSANYKYWKGTLLRIIDGIPTIDWKDNDKVSSAPERRATHMTRAFLTNMKLGEEYGWKIENYPLAEQYQEDYYHGVCQAFVHRDIDMTTPQERLIEVGNNYAYNKLLERIQPKDGVPDVFLSTLPGSYFEEYERFQKMERKINLDTPLKFESSNSMDLKSIEIQENGQTLFVKEPVKVGTDDWNILMGFLDARYKEGVEKGLAGKKLDKLRSVVKVAIMPNKDIWALPYRLSNSEKTQHSIAARGNPCVWAGEVEIVDGKILDDKMIGDSGHFRTYGGVNPDQQRAIFQFALSAFRSQGYETEEILDNSKIGIKHRGGNASGWATGMSD